MIAPEKKDSADTREVIAQYLTRAFASMLSKGDVRLSFNMETLLTPMMTVLLTISAQGKPMTLFDLKQFLNDKTNVDLVAFGAKTIRNRGLNDFFRTTFHESQFSMTKFSLKVKLSRLLNSQMFVRLLCQKRSSWDVENLMNTGKTILINASQSHLGSEVSEIYGRTITALIQSYAFLRARQKRKKYCPVFFIIDEASSFITPDIETILTQARKFGLHLILANQVVKQGGIRPELHEAMMGNTALKIVGNAGYTTKQTMSSEMELKKDDLSNLSVGNFVIKADGKKVHRVHLPRFWLGNKQLCTQQEWADAKRYFIENYYPKPASRSGANPKKSAPTPRRASQRPKFGIASPFDSIRLFTPLFL